MNEDWLRKCTMVGGPVDGRTVFLSSAAIYYECVTVEGRAVLKIPQGLHYTRHRYKSTKAIVNGIEMFDYISEVKG